METAVVGTQPGLVWVRQPTRHTAQLLGDMRSPGDLPSSSFLRLIPQEELKLGGLHPHTGSSMDAAAVPGGCSCGTAAEVEMEPSATKERGRTVPCGEGIKQRGQLGSGLWKNLRSE